MKKWISGWCCGIILGSALFIAPAWGEPQKEAPTVGEERREEKKAAVRVAEVERGGALLPPWRLVIEPFFEYDHFSGQNVSISGFTIFEAILIGRVAVEKVKRDIFIPGVTFRLGMRDSELNLRVPYLARQDKLIFPRSGGGTNDLIEKNFGDSSVGDLDMFYYYHLLKEGRWRSWVPDTIVRVGAKFPTGKSPYNLNREFIPELGSVIATEFPTGTGHWGGSVGVTFVKSVDPAVLFLNLGYFYNFARSVNNLSIQGVGIADEVKLGNSLEWSLGLIFALQERLSLNFALNQRLVSRTTVNTINFPGNSIARSDVALADTSLNVVAFNIGATYVVNPRWAIDFVVGIGISRDAPDVTVLIRNPINFQF